MANMGFYDKHNMVAFLQKPTGSEEFHQIVDFLAGSHIRKHLQLADVNGLSSLPNTEIFEQLTQMGPKKTSWEHFSSNIATAIICLATNRTFKFSQLVFDGGYTLGSVEGSMKLNELMELCTKLFDKVTSLEKDLKQTKEVHGKAITKLVKKVKHLEDKLKSTTKRRKARLVILDEEEDLVSEDPSKQGKMEETEYKYVEEEYAEVEYDLNQTKQQITPTKDPQGKEQSQEAFKAQLSVLSIAKIFAEASRERVKTYDKRRRSTDSSRDSTAGGLFSTAEEFQGTDEDIAQKLNEEEMAKAAAREEHKRIDFEKALEL
ncbi:hypothetical protein Tco_1043401 [Tanacetum coccineum]|uniref:Uncharacterized protein n=1 Tax=Tanacetum coccineum TaxID=301880 RepID=A0ABQ5GN69_9ASTR